MKVNQTLHDVRPSSGLGKNISIFGALAPCYTKFGLLISRGSAATYLTRGGQCYVSFVVVANFRTSLSMKEF